MTKRSSALLASTLFASLALASPAMAGSADGKLQVKAFGTAVLPTGNITDVVTDNLNLPATVTVKYHFDVGGIKPYVGAGPAYFFIFSEDVGANAATLGATRVNLSDELGFALQGGVDIPLNDKGLGLGIDAKRYFVGTTATFFAGNNIALQTEHELDPWVVSAGLTYRF